MILDRASCTRRVLVMGGGVSYEKAEMHKKQHLVVGDSLASIPVDRNDLH